MSLRLMCKRMEGSAATGGEGASGGELAAVRFSLLLSFVGLTKESRGLNKENDPQYWEEMHPSIYCSHI